MALWGPHLPGTYCSSSCQLPPLHDTHSSGGTDVRRIRISYLTSDPRSQTSTQIGLCILLFAALWICHHLHEIFFGHDCTKDQSSRIMEGV